MIVYRRRALKKKTRKRRPEYVPCHIYLSPDKLKFIHTTGGDLQFLPVFLFICAKGLTLLRKCDAIYIYSVPLYHETPACVKKKEKLFPQSTKGRTVSSFLLGLVFLLPLYHTHPACVNTIYIPNRASNQSAQMPSQRVRERACPTLGIWDEKACGRGSMRWFHRGPRTKGAPEFGS